MSWLTLSIIRFVQNDLKGVTAFTPCAKYSQRIETNRHVQPVSTYEQKRTRQSLMLNTINNMPRTVQWKSILTSLFSMWNVSNGCFSDRQSHDIKKQSILFRKKHSRAISFSAMMKQSLFCLMVSIWWSMLQIFFSFTFFYVIVMSVTFNISNSSM